MEVSAERFAERLEIYRLKPPKKVALPIICIDGLIRPIREYAQWVHPLEPVSLDDLKNWVGIPNAVARKAFERPSALRGGNHACSPLREVCMTDLPLKKFRFERLEPRQQQAVQQLATNMLYGYVDEAEAKEPHVAAVISNMLERAKGIKAFVAPDLIVCPDDHVTFQGFSTLIFNNILVYGSGQVSPGHFTKVDAVQIRHVN